MLYCPFSDATQYARGHDNVCSASGREDAPPPGRGSARVGISAHKRIQCLQLPFDERGSVDCLDRARSWMPTSAQKAENCRTASL